MSIDGNVINTPIIANIIARLVNKPNITVGTKLEKHNVRKPSDIAIDVINTAFPTLRWDNSIIALIFLLFCIFNLYLYK